MTANVMNFISLTAFQVYANLCAHKAALTVVDKALEVAINATLAIFNSMVFAKLNVLLAMRKIMKTNLVYNANKLIVLC